MKRRPIHPGELILRDYLVPKGVSCRQLSRALGVTNSRFAKVLAGRSDLDADLSLRLSRVLGKPARYWLGRQGTYDLWKAKQRIDFSELGRIGNITGYWLALSRNRKSPPAPAGSRLKSRQRRR